MRWQRDGFLPEKPPFSFAGLVATVAESLLVVLGRTPGTKVKGESGEALGSLCPSSVLGLGGWEWGALGLRQVTGDPRTERSRESGDQFLRGCQLLGGRSTRPAGPTATADLPVSRGQHCSLCSTPARSYGRLQDGGAGSGQEGERGLPCTGEAGFCCRAAEEVQDASSI